MSKLEWVKAMVLKLRDLIPHRFIREIPEETEPAPGVLTELDKKLGQEILKRQAKMGKAVATSRGGPNMPKYQFCRCGRRAKRTDKAQMAGREGAFYKCNIHGEFFVAR